MQITRDMKMAGVIHLNYLLLPILTRFNISLGFGDKTVDEICQENNVNIDFFLEIFNSYHDKSYFPKKQLQDFPVGLMVQYLRKTHDYYLNEKIPEIEEMINELIKSCVPENRKNLELIKKFFLDYKHELSVHIGREDDKTLPYILEVENAFNTGTVPETLIRQMEQYSIEDYAMEHDNVEDKLFDLKNIIIKYLPPIKNRELCNTILFELFRLESDLNDHARMEDKVLTPKVRYMERKLMKKSVR
jgi:regulator of cell morphogenesis and NO signaling